MAAFIEGIPKGELHLHIEGTLEPDLKFELAARNGIALPYESVEEAIAGYDFDSLTSFLVGYYEGMGVLIEEQDFYDLGMAYFRKVAAENLIYAEIFFDPQGHTSREVPFANVINGRDRARQDAASELGVEAQLIMCFLRDMSADSAMETLEQAEPYKDLIIAVGLDSDERDNPPVKFREVYDKARSQGYRLTMHCDVDQNNTTEHIRQALFEIGVERIDHGVNSLDDDALATEIIKRGMGLTVCPISNIQVVQNSKSSQIKTMLDKGMLVTINSDDPAYFQGYITDNLKTVQSEAGLSKEEVAQLVRNTFTISWAPEESKAMHLRRLDDYLAIHGGD
ncbi:MAG: adenosine deaminase [Actinobacteria bacterium]|nr:adenosine deaminase [Actinomycetota bacterium]